MKIMTVIFWLLVAIFIAPTLYFGYAKIVATPDKVKQFSAWNYPIWLMRLLGLAEVSAAIAIVFEQTRLIGISLWAIILAGAIYTNLIHKEPKEEVMNAIFVSSLLGGIFVISQYFL